MGRSRYPQDYNVILQYTVQVEYTEDNIDSKKLEHDKTFWLVSKDKTFNRRYSVESAPKWVMRIYNYYVDEDKIHNY